MCYSWLTEQKCYLIQLYQKAESLTREHCITWHEDLHVNMLERSDGCDFSAFMALLGRLI